MSPKPVKRAKPPVAVVKERKPEYFDVVEKHKAMLTRIFTYYASFGEPMNADSLRSAKFIKLLKDAGLLTEPNGNYSASKSRFKVQLDPFGLTKVQADLMFKRYTGLKKTPHYLLTSPSCPNLKPASSFNMEAVRQSAKKEVSNLGRMNFDTLMKALAEIAETGSNLGPSTALHELIKNHLV